MTILASCEEYIEETLHVGMDRSVNAGEHAIKILSDGEISGPLPAQHPMKYSCATTTFQEYSESTLILAKRFNNPLEFLLHQPSPFRLGP